MPQITTGPTVADSAQILPGVIENSDISASAAIAGTKLALTDHITNAMINSAAAIADSKLAQITTASKVSGAAITSLASVPAGAGVLPSANTPTKPVDMFVPATSNVGAFTGVAINGERYFDHAATGDTSSYCSFVIPSGATISTIKMVQVSNGTQTGDVVYQFAFADTPGGGASTTDGGANNTFTIPSASGQVNYFTVPGAEYNGLTQGRLWTCKITRKGSDGADTFSVVSSIMGLLIQFA